MTDSLRDHVKKWRKEFSTYHPEEKRAAEQSCLKFVQSVLADNDGVVASYRALPEELSLNELSGRDFAFPRMKENGQMDFVLNPESWTKHSWGIEEPEGTAMNPEDIAVALVPGVAFDHKGRRLGQGKGYYDRYFADSKALKVGIAFHQQMQEEELQAEEWDVNMDLVITDRFIVDVTGVARASGL